MIEEWKGIIGYENDYLISSFGEVKSIKQNKERLLKKQIDNMGLTELVFCKGYTFFNFPKKDPCPNLL